MAFQFLSFIRENRAGALLSGAAALCTYGAWMTRQDITVDTEIMMADPDAMMNSWLGINRFGLVFTKHLFGQAAFHPVISRVLTVILLWITAMVLSFFVHKWSGGQKRFRLFSAVLPASRSSSILCCSRRRWFSPCCSASWRHTEPDNLPFLEENGSGRQARFFFWFGPLERTRPWRLWRRL